MIDLLPSWRPGATRDAVEAFLAASRDLPVDQRVAVLDNDGTLWCEKPGYVQYDFLVAQLHAAVAADPSVGERTEYRALLAQDKALLGELGLQRVAMALLELCAGVTPEEFTDRVHRFMAEAVHTRGVPYPKLVYQPMRELLGALRAHEFSVFVVTGGGTEFVRAVSAQLYGVAPDDVVGTLVEYHYAEHDGHPALERTAEAYGEVNEGPAKVAHIQTQLGRRPVFAAGNSGGDRQMLEYAAAAGPPSLALLLDHDDADREYAYTSKAVSFAETEAITDVARREGWTVVSMRDDWTRIFAA
ncbi:haloacid dehalogenase [Catellatospora sp. TT07R-123]|uniref:HAD family hydrolase n=1 Tax=Catellatospora sp. TT07R-123 TaxID=2733863 RepID=UPI001B157A83|nr:HAD family hydrolase [Catellatospora sp. TT07R-123]GHJ50065.1 haloacid dehalogenase [Catellatospora sp. TT07R-123]